MVERVGAVAAGAENVGQRRALHHGDRVNWPVVGTLLTVNDVRGRLCGKILPERPSQGRVHDLCAPADAKGGKVPGGSFLDEDGFQGVPHRSQCAALWQDGFAVAGRVDVLAAGDQQAVAAVQSPAGRLRIGGQGQDHGHQTAGLQGLGVGREHPDALELIVPEGRDADNLFHNGPPPFSSARSPQAQSVVMMFSR